MSTPPAASSTTVPASARGGLRERKKARTRAAIRAVAMDLFEAQGYAATTVEQIADAAEVSPSTFFRYFPTKEDVVLTDEYDPLIADAIGAQPASMHPIDAVLAAMREVFSAMTPEEIDEERRRQRFFKEVPELRARMMHQTTQVVGLFADVISDRQGLPRGDFGARVMAGAVVGTVMAVMSDADGDYDFRDLDRIEKALILLRDGLPLG